MNVLQVERQTLALRALCTDYILVFLNCGSGDELEYGVIQQISINAE